MEIRSSNNSVTISSYSFSCPAVSKNAGKSNSVFYFNIKDKVTMLVDYSGSHSSFHIQLFPITIRNDQVWISYTGSTESRRKWKIAGPVTQNNYLTWVVESELL